MIDAPPPMSEPSSTTTPAEMRPSTIEVPSVPALKLTKPSCMTVVPAARCAPSRTRSASAIRTPGGRDVVDHPRELVDAVHRDRAAPPQPGSHRLEAVHRARPEVGPHHVGQDAEDPVDAGAVRLDQPMGQQVQPQVGVVGVGGLVVQRRDHRAHHDDVDVAVLVAAGQLGQLGGNLGHRQPHGARRAVAGQLGRGEPRVEDGSVGGDGRHADA